MISEEYAILLRTNKAVSDELIKNPRSKFWRTRYNTVCEELKQLEQKENESQMRLRHEKELQELEDNCSHKERTEWIEYYWAPGHILGKCRVCTFCGKIMEKTWKEPLEMIFVNGVEN